MGSTEGRLQQMVERVESPGKRQSVEDAVYGRVTRRLMPILFLSYVIAYLDRVNVGFAKLQMLHDLGFSEAMYGLGAGIFFVGYCCAEVPSNMVLARVGARKWLARIMVSWGIISACMLFVRSPNSFYIMRCLLGVAEAGMFPGVIYYLACWYPAQRRGRMIALFMVAQPVTGVIGGPLSGWIMQSLQGSMHLAGWQWLFLLEGLPAVVMGVVFYLYIDDKIGNARWLCEDEKQMLESSILAELRHKREHVSFFSVLRDSRVWLLCAISFTSVMGLYGIGFWLPSIIRATGVERPLQIGLLTMIPYGAAIVTMYFASRSSDRSGERRWHLAILTAVGGVGLIFSTFGTGNTALSLVGLTIATAGISTSQPLFWNLPTAFLGGSAAAAAIAFVNLGGNVAGFFSPYAVGWISNATHSTTVGMYLLAFSLFLSAALVLYVPASLVNSRKIETESSHT